jgi:hypothetical protein
MGDQNKGKGLTNDKNLNILLCAVLPELLQMLLDTPERFLIVERETDDAGAHRRFGHLYLQKLFF